MPAEFYWTRNGDRHYLTPGYRPAPDDFFRRLIAESDRQRKVGKT